MNWLVLVVLWTSVALVLAGLQSLSLERSLPPPSTLLFQVALWLPWVPATPVVFWLHGRLPLPHQTRGRLGQHLAAHAALAVAIGFVLTTALAVAELRLAGMELPSIGQLLGLVWRSGRSNVLLTALVYAVVLATATGIWLQRHAHERERQLTRARLLALRTQLRPHFLFNTLHAVGSLIDEEPRAAQSMIARLSDLLRASLDDGDREVVSLGAELDLVRSYLEIEAVRFEDRLSVQWDVDDSLLDAPVPRFILQPLVENAIRHGIEPTRLGGCVTVSARRQADTLVLEIVDDGQGLDETDGTSDLPKTLGVGLTNTQARLQVMYGRNGDLSVSKRSEGGTRATITLPLRAPESARLRHLSHTGTNSLANPPANSRAIMSRRLPQATRGNSATGRHSSTRERLVTRSIKS